MKKFNSKRIAVLGLLTALGLIVFIIESLFPPLFLPGAKMGLSNIFTILAIVLLSPIDAVILVVARTVIGSFIVGNLSTLIYSLSAGLVAVIVSSLMYRFAFPKITLVAVSVFSAVIHNLTQNAVFCLITGTYAMFAYSPYLALLGVLAGVIVGITAEFIIKALPDSLLDKIGLYNC